MPTPVVRVLLALVVLFTIACRPAPARTTSAASAIRAGTSGEYPPLSTWEGSHVEGFAPALLSAFARAEERPLTWTRFRWPELVSDLRAGRFDVAADGITVRPERSVAGRFTVPIARGGAVLLLRRPAWAAAAKDVPALDRPELRVAVNRGGHLERVTRSLFHAADVRAIGDNAGVRDALARGDVDAAMTNTFEAPRWAAGLEGVEEMGPLSRDVTALWVRADREDIARRLDAWLLDEEESGRLADLRARMLGKGAGPRTAEPLGALLAATSERLALMPLVAAAKQRSGRSVEDPAQEERVLAAARDEVAKAASDRGRTPPAREKLDAFFRAQLDAAKRVQERGAPPDSGGELSLERDLRPATARITARMAFLLVRLAPAASESDVVSRAHEDLAATALDAGTIERLAKAIVAVAGAGP